jgi:hypothetical protein
MVPKKPVFEVERPPNCEVGGLRRIALIVLDDQLDLLAVH